MRIRAFWESVILLVAPDPNFAETFTAPFPNIAKANLGQCEPAGLKCVSLRTPCILKKY